MRTDLYAILEVSPRASEEVIHAAYRILAKNHKDDERKLRALNQAKDILLDADKRADYDKDRSGTGKVIGDKYKVQELIAEGGFGKTYKGEHIVLKTPVCIKHASSVSPQDEALLLEEAKAIWDLRHYSIPAMRDVLRLTDGSLALVMSYVPGPTLQEVIEKKVLDSEHVAWITERILNALKYMHFHGIVHGDIKPGNIIVQPTSHTVVIVDYGLSLIRPGKGSMSKGYTPFFAAPEQLTGETLVPETDFYGLGMTMIACLGGDVEHKKVPSHTTPELCELVRRLIRRDVLARPNWESEDLCATIQKVREKDFGRRSSNMKPLPI